MAARDPLNAQVRRNLATLLCLVGELALEQEGTATAIPVLEKSLAVFESMPVPHNIQTAWGLAKAQYVLGDAYRRQGQPQRSAALFRPSSQVLRDMRSRGVLPALNAAFADQALAAMAVLGRCELRVSSRLFGSWPDMAFGKITPCFPQDDFRGVWRFKFAVCA
jgi:hypothetical protein